MKIVFVAFRHDPFNKTKLQGADRNFLNTFEANGTNCHVIGPFIETPCFLERVARKLIRKWTDKHYLKYDISNTIKASLAVSRLVRLEKFDLIFSLYPPPFVFYSEKTPCVFRTDTTILGVLEQTPEFYKQSLLLQKISLWIEKRAIKNSCLIITHSEWSKKVLINNYHVESEKIVVFPNPSSLPSDAVPEALNIQKEKADFDKKLRLLFIGSDPHRKGLSIAIQTTKLLNKLGQPATLSICGTSGENEEHIEFVGYLSRNDNSQFNHYLNLLTKAHLLIHPALFDPAPRVTAEAAAFGTPTITNDTGGLATSVKDGVSGIVLPKGSPPDAYVQTIIDLVNDPERYRHLCQTTRERYEKELNWDVAGKRLVQILEQLVAEHRCTNNGKLRNK